MSQTANSSTIPSDKAETPVAESPSCRVLQIQAFLSGKLSEQEFHDCYHMGMEEHVCDVENEEDFHLPESEKKPTYRELQLQSFLKGELEFYDFHTRYMIDLELEAHIRVRNGGSFDEVYDEETGKLQHKYQARFYLPYSAMLMGERKWLQSYARTMRTCGVCLSKNPRQRCAFTSCGHVVCRACAEQLSLDAGYPGPHYRPVAICPFCRENSNVLLLQNDYDLEKEVDERRPRLSELDVIAKQYLAGEIEENDYKKMYDLHIKMDARAHKMQGGLMLEVYAAEYKRLEVELPEKPDVDNMHISAAEAFWRRRQARLVRICRAENEIRVKMEYRLCRSCGYDQPKQRCAFTVCGHTVCRDCAKKANKRAERRNRRERCPCCGEESGAIDLFEGPISVNQ